jgi:hypothetical protein
MQPIYSAQLIEGEQFSRIHHENHRTVDRRLPRDSARHDVVERSLYVTDAAA